MKYICNRNGSIFIVHKNNKLQRLYYEDPQTFNVSHSFHKEKPINLQQYSKNYLLINNPPKTEPNLLQYLIDHEEFFILNKIELPQKFEMQLIHRIQNTNIGDIHIAKILNHNTTTMLPTH